jgi:hypothetical protein
MYSGQIVEGPCGGALQAPAPSLIPKVFCMPFLAGASKPANKEEAARDD